MGFLSRLERRSHPSSPDAFTTAFFGGRPSATGVVVTPDSSLMYSAVWRAVSLITKSIASIPLNTYAYLAGTGRSLNTTHALYDLLHNTPNSWQTSYEWREMMAGHLELRGNAYSQIVTGGNGKITQLLPLNPDRVTAYYKPVVPGGPKVRFYDYRPLDGPAQVLFWDEMLHWRGFSVDGVTGISRIAMARETIGVALASEEHGARFFSNDATPGGVLSHPKTLSEEAAKRLKKSWNDKQRGVTHAHEVSVLEEGLMWTKIGVDNKDAQFLETRKFQIDEVARWFDIPPHKLMEMGASTFGNIEEQNIEFVSDAIMPRCENLAQSCMRDLMSPDDRKKNFIAFVVKGLIQGDRKSRYEAYGFAKNAGWMSADDIRAEENMNPIPDGAGAMYLVPLNMVPADKINAIADKAATPTPAPVIAPPPDDAPADDAGKKTRSAHIAELRSRITAAHHHIVVDAVRRSLTREIIAGRRALEAARVASSTAPIIAFVDDFYRDHEPVIVRSLHPATQASVDAIAALVISERAAAPVAQELLDVLALETARAMAKTHVAQSRAELRAILKASTPDSCAAAVEACFVSWESTRSALDATTDLSTITEAVVASVASQELLHAA